MKLGLAIGYSGATMDLPVKRVQLAERLGYDSVWTAEAYGSDAVTPLAYLGAVTERIKLGTGIMQVSARTPANAAMCAGTIDAMAGSGRFLAGLGVSGPQIVEGWYGEPWGRPYYWLKDYVEIMRKVFRRGKPLTSILHMNPDIPIYIGSGNEATVRLTGEVADGWLPLGYTPGTFHEYKGWLEEGFARAKNGKGFHNFEIQASVHVEIDEDVAAALNRLKPREALYIGGMGHKNKNFHKDMMIRRGYADAADRIQELFLAGRKKEAAEAVPDEWVDSKSLVGPPARIKERYKVWDDCEATSVTVRTQQDEAVILMADAARLNPT